MRFRKYDNVHVNVLEAPIGDLKITDRGNDVFCHFGSLTRNTFSGPLGDILSHAGPDDGLGN